MAAIVIFTSLTLVNSLPPISAEASVNLATADSFAVLAGSTVTNTGTSLINGNVGVHSGTAVTGLEDEMVNGEIHRGDAVAAQAKEDLTLAYDDAAGRPDATALAEELGGQTLTPGVYGTGAGQLTGSLTLDGLGDPTAVWIFQLESTLITASNSAVVLIGEAQACNVFWQVGSSATLGTDTDFLGNILAQESITINNGATLDGRALARTAAVTLDSNVISVAECAEPPGDETPGDETPGDETPGDETQDEGTQDEGTQDEGTQDEGTQDEGTQDEGTQDEGTQDEGTQDEGTQDEHPSLVCSTGLMATANGDTSISLTWSPVNGAEQYRLYRAVGGGAFMLHDEVDADAMSFIDTNTKVDLTYGYEVRPVAAGVESEDCDVVEVTAIPVFSSLMAAASAAAIGIAAYVVFRRKD